MEIVNERWQVHLQDVRGRAICRYSHSASHLNMYSDAVNVMHFAQKFCFLAMILYSCSCK